MINSFRGEYACFSNFHPAEVIYDGDTYPTTEHAYQAAKSLDLLIRKQIREAKYPGDAKRLGQSIERGGIVKIRRDWEGVKIPIMKYLLIQKFREDKYRNKLLATADHVLVEGNWWCDNFWGNCSCDKCIEIPGENHLGKLLMEVRNEIKARQ